jgi:uncharacterized protein
VTDKVNSIKSNGPFRLAFVTGASSGIGKALCRLLAREGIHLAITGRNKHTLYQLADEIRTHVNVVVYPADLSKQDEREVIIRKIHELSPDLVINNAGFGLYGEVVQVDKEELFQIIEVNETAVLDLCVESAKAILNSDHNGVILNVSSVGAFMPFPGNAVYGAAKAFVNSLSLAMDEELRGKGVRVLAACPGMVKTNFSYRASQGKQKSKSKKQKMSPEYAAEQIWTQIKKRKPVHIFDGKYRFFVFLIKYILPTRLVLKYLRKSMSKMYQDV